ncbi:hypothetical protein EK21DRAFT_88067 [Setomelanomma holmii]|uniref:Uncharacterized protein n=1 Tax=Setomelanomma holmii TaxID=210430 RepID=A0A9P4LNK7_9PLEO|nr:hypothetical protein EK21DRAFT_88067 [Setomelanomma holmii]
MPPQPDTTWQRIVANKAAKLRRNSLLLYLWKLMPATSDGIIPPDDNTKVYLYRKFIQSCEYKQAAESSIKALFDRTYSERGYPWLPEHTLATESGKAWVTTFAQAAIKFRIGNRDAKSKTVKQISQETIKLVEDKVYVDWFPILDEIFKKLLAEEEDELKDTAAAEASRFK